MTEETKDTLKGKTSAPDGEEGKISEPEAPDIKEPDGDEDEGEDKSKEKLEAKYEKAVEESKKRKERAQKAEKERDTAKAENEDLKKRLGMIQKGLDPKEDEPEDIDKKVKEEADKLRKDMAIKTEFRIEAAHQGMDKELIKDLLPTIKFEDIEYDHEEDTVEGMEEFVKKYKAKYPNRFIPKKPEDTDSPPTPPKHSETPPSDVVQIIADRSGLTPEEVINQDKRKIKALEKAKKEPGNMAERWGVSKHLAMKE